MSEHKHAWSVFNTQTDDVDFVRSPLGLLTKMIEDEQPQIAGSWG